MSFDIAFFMSVFRSCSRYFFRCCFLSIVRFSLFS